ncbi:MAG: hypothetical protein LUH02_05110 [Erysipelotrichaceae bacterium]|nr:hypothetical protein [Erysipelotrichaceae bacterium]
MDNQNEIFKNKIMSDYVNFNENYSDKSGFPFLEISSREYELQKYFEIRIEDYIRNILVNDVLCAALENKGVRIYKSELPEMQDNIQKHFNNTEYEKLAHYEFIAEYGNKTVMYRYTDIDPNDVDNILLDLADEITILNWSIPGHLPKALENENYKTDKNINIICLKDFFKDNFDVKYYNEYYEKYVGFLTSTILDFQDFIGVKSSFKLTPTIMGTFRFQAEQNFIEHIEEIEKFFKSDKKIKSMGFPDDNDISYGYQIIDEKNKDDFSSIEQSSKDLLIKIGILKSFKDNKIYRYFIGESDFSKSFLTSEYLYNEYKESNCFDYTAIVSGYLKSIEQLLYHIAMFSVDKGFKIKYNGKRYDNGERPTYHNINNVRKVCFSSEYILFADTSMGSLIHFFDDNPSLFCIDKQYIKTIIDCLNCYRIECRNNSFHLDNLDNLSRVYFIRWNTLFLYIVLLSCCKLGENETETLNSFKVIKNDQFERLYYLISQGITSTFDFYFIDENGNLDNGQRVIFLPSESSYPSYNDVGLITSASLTFENINTKQKILVMKKIMPDEIWWIDEKGNKFLIE